MEQIRIIKEMRSMTKQKEGQLTLFDSVYVWENVPEPSPCSGGEDFGGSRRNLPSC
jgi:hypothetical protein